MTKADEQRDPSRGPIAAPVGGEHMMVFAADELEALRTALLKDAPVEAAAFLFARAVLTPRGAWRLVVYDTMHLAAADYTRRSATAIELPPELVATVLQRARLEYAAVVLVHSHPADSPAGPSSEDHRGERALIPALARRVPGVPHARLIVGPTLTHAALFLPSPEGLAASGDAVCEFAGDTSESMRVLEVGRELRVIDEAPVGRDVIEADASATRRHEEEAFERQVRAFGSDGQARLRAIRVAVVGAGGTGSVVLQQLTYLGVRKVLVVDPDVIESTNLNRVVGASPSDTARAKVDVAEAMMRRIRPDVEVEAVRADVRDVNIARRLLDYDFFFACTDSQGSRAVMTQLAYQFLLPGIDLGVAIQVRPAGGVSHISGRVQMLAPGLACLLCAEVLDPEVVRRDLLTDDARAADPYILGAMVPQPAVISINSAAASLAVTMFLSAVTGIPVAARAQRLRLESGVVSNIATRPDPACPWCARDGARSRGDSWPMPGRGTFSTHVPTRRVSSAMATPVAPR